MIPGSRDDARADVYRRLAALENTGVGLQRSVARLVEQGGTGARLLAEVDEGLTAGLDPGAAFTQTRSLTRFEGQIVASGARAGTLAESFGALADHFEERARLKRRTALALTYPVLLLHAAALLPAVPALFAGGLGAFAWAALLPLGIGYGVVGGALLLWRVLGSGSGGAADAVVLAVPLVRGVVFKGSLIAGLRVLRICYANGVPMLGALESAATACPNARVGRIFERIREEVAQGSSVGAAFGLQRELPSVVLQLVATGEESGDLEGLLAKAEERLEDEARQARYALIAAAGVSVFLLAAGVVAYKVITFYTGYFSQLQEIGPR